MGWYGLDRSGSGQGPVDDSCEHGKETLRFQNFLGKFLSSCSNCSFSRRVLFRNGFRDRAISLYSSTQYRQATLHVLALVAKYIDAESGILEKYIILGKLYQFCHLNNKYRL
jgi:hypothetical protein